MMSVPRKAFARPWGPAAYWCNGFVKRSRFSALRPRLATEKITRKTLTDDDQRKLVEETLAELDFSALAGSSGSKA